MQLRTKYDVAIVGGGLAGLATAIQLSRAGFSVIVFEKEAYPFHKVCGEYISMESWPFLESLGVPLSQFGLPEIDTLHLTAPNGNSFTTKLPLGGFGISRYLLDATLARLATEAGVHLLQQTKVDAIDSDGLYTIRFNNQTIHAVCCCAAWGKRSNMDVKWKRNFLTNSNKSLTNYVAVKYHIKKDGQSNIIGLHNFKDGYCGISKLEGEEYCLCYMTRAENLKAHNNSINLMQKKVLYKNRHLREIFTQCEIVKEFPITISQISFSAKSKTENGVLMLGDSAGMITPLCGNGMSIALHTSKIAAALLADFLKGHLSQEQLEQRYKREWAKQFARRLQTGRLLQSFFGSNWLSNFFVGSFRAFPFLARPLIKQTHGKPF